MALLSVSKVDQNYPLTRSESGRGERCNVDAGKLTSLLENRRHVLERVLVVWSSVEWNANIATVHVVRDSSLVLNDSLLSSESSPVAVVNATALRFRDCDSHGFRVLAVPLDERTIRVGLLFDELFGEAVPCVVGGDVEGSGRADLVVFAGKIERDQRKPCSVIDYMNLE